jgi:hypothetical protein
VFKSFSSAIPYLFAHFSFDRIEIDMMPSNIVAGIVATLCEYASLLTLIINFVFLCITHLICAEINKSV